MCEHVVGTIGLPPQQKLIYVQILGLCVSLVCHLLRARKNVCSSIGPKGLVTVAA